MDVKNATYALPVEAVMKTINWATSAATWKIKDLVVGRRGRDLRGEELELELQGGGPQDEEEEEQEAELLRMVRTVPVLAS